MQNAVRLLVQVSIAILLVVCSSCNAYYQSNMQQVPLLQAKGDLVFNLGPKDLQCAYAVSDQIGLLANGQYRNHSWDLDSLYDSFGTEPGLINEFRRRSITRYGELAAGYFKQGGGSQLVFEFYAGVGLGKLEYEGDGCSKNSEQRPESGFPTAMFWYPKTILRVGLFHQIYKHVICAIIAHKLLRRGAKRRTAERN